MHDSVVSFESGVGGEVSLESGQSREGAETGTTTSLSDSINTVVSYSAIGSFVSRGQMVEQIEKAEVSLLDVFNKLLMHVNQSQS